MSSSEDEERSASSEDEGYSSFEDDFEEERNSDEAGSGDGGGSAPAIADGALALLEGEVLDVRGKRDCDVSMRARGPRAPPRLPQK